MSYNLTRTDGTPLLTLADGQTNTTTTSLTLIGKNYAGYGTFLNENFVKLLEHFSSVTAPDNPSVGQLWWQSSTKILKVYIGNNAWKSITGAQAEASSPTYKVTGDLWWDTTNQQLKVWSGASWITIGPSFTQTTGTSGAVADTIVDDALVTHVVVKFFVNNGLVAMLSKDNTFTPGNAIPGFSTVKPGLNLATGTVPGLKYWTTAENADYLGNVAASLYLRSDVSVPLTTQLEIRNLNGIAIQESNGTIDFTLGVASNFVNLISLVRGNGLKITTKPDLAAGALIDALTVDRNTGLIRVYNDPQDALGIATKNYVDSGLTTLQSSTNTNLTILGSQLVSNVAAINSNIGDIRLLKSTGTVSTPNGNVVANIVSLSANVGPFSGVIANQGSITANIKALAGNIGWTGLLSSDDLTVTGNINNFAANVGPMTFIAHQTTITSNIQAIAGNIGWTGNLSSDQLNITGNIKSFATNVGAMSNIAHQASITANIRALAGNIGWTGNLSSDQLNITGNIKSFATNVGPINAVGGQTIVANINTLWSNIGSVPTAGTASSVFGGQTIAANTTAIWGNIGENGNLSSDQTTVTGNIKSFATNVGAMTNIAHQATITANIRAIAGNIGWTGNLSSDQLNITGNIKSFATNVGPLSSVGGQTIVANIQALWGNVVPSGGTPGGQTLAANVTAIWSNIGVVPLSGVASSAFGGQTIAANTTAIWGNIGVNSNLSSDQATVTGNIKSFATNVGPLSSVGGQTIVSNVTAIWANIGSVPTAGTASSVFGGQTLAANTTAIWGNIGVKSNLSADQLTITGNIKSFATNVGPINAVGGMSVVANISAIWANIGSVPTAGTASSVFGGQSISANTTAIWANINSLASSIGGIGASTDTVLRDGTRSITGNLTPDATGTRAVGNVAYRFDAFGDTFDFTGAGHFHSSITTKNGINMGNSAASGRMGTIFATTFNGTATTAQYADLAERFESDSAYLPGTVVMLGGVNEITAAMEDASDEVFGVISTKPAHLMNNRDGYTDQTHPPVAMTGRVPVRVIGMVKKGDRLISAGNGVARAAKPGEYTAFNTIGRSLENKTTTGEGVVEATVKLNS